MYNLLEEDCEILVVNAHHLKTVPVSPESAEESLSKPRLSWQAAIVLLMSIPGSSERAAQCILAEIGIQMQQFPSAQHLARWRGNLSREQGKCGQTVLRQNAQRQSLASSRTDPGRPCCCSPQRYLSLCPVSQNCQAPRRQESGYGGGS